MFHESFCQGNRIPGIAVDAGTFDYVLGGAAVAGVTYIVTVQAADVAAGRCSTEKTGKRSVFGKIFKVCAAEKTAGSVGHGRILSNVQLLLPQRTHVCAAASAKAERAQRTENRKISHHGSLSRKLCPLVKTPGGCARLFREVMLP
jgi:hypothetical protein